jgi:phosphoenolpyruvate synthase/pyruvate phosphate dikinase
MANADEAAKLGERGVSVLHHIERVIEEERRALEMRFAGLDRLLDEREKALSRTAEVLHEKLRQMNEFRAETTSDREQYARKAEVELRLAAMEKALQEQTKIATGRAWIAGILAGLALLTAAVNLLAR